MALLLYGLYTSCYILATNLYVYLFFVTPHPPSPQDFYETLS